MVPSDKPLSIILAEDDADDRAFFKEALQDLKIDTVLTIYNDGQALLDGLNETNDVPDFLFLDLNMPKLNGLQSLEQVRKIERFNNIPIVAIFTTSNEEKDQDTTFKAGANAFITKPTKFNELKVLLAKVLKIDWSKAKDRKSFVIKIN